MSTVNFLEYVHNNLGVNILLTPPIQESSVVLDQEGEDDQDVVSTFCWEKSPAPVLSTQRFSAFFLRVSDEFPSLSQDHEAYALFSKLRSAIGFDMEVAPWVEASLGTWQEVLRELRPHATRVLLMMDDCVDRGVQTGSEWIIPDPKVLLIQPELKRPTWELLKDWIKE